MIYIAVMAVIGILLLQSSGAIPQDSVGGSMVIGFALLAATPAVAIHEAWTKRRGVLGWIVNLVVSFVGALVAAPIGGALIAMLLSGATTGRSLAATGGPVMSVALILMTGVVIGGAWGALWLVNRWRDRPAAGA